MRNRIITVIGSILLTFNIQAQVTVHINSGNPAYPFPQFLEYAYGDSHRLGNLGTQNAEGVVHAEMEQDIRDAYQIHANEFAYTGDSWAGIKYIETPYKAAYDCTEGDGYALLAAAYMADQVTFNGYWMCTHDKRLAHVKRYIDCQNNASNYAYGTWAIGDGSAGDNTAADGDVDVALALYVAYKQWGEFMRNEAGEIVKDACGNPISYKEAMIQVLRGLVALSTTRYDDVSNGGTALRVNSGLIGLDGYQKGGDTWVELTGWATQSNPLVFNESRKIYNTGVAGVGNALTEVDIQGIKLYPEYGGSYGSEKFGSDYCAPAYYREFYELFEELGGDPWEIEQYRRGEASSDWLIGQLISANKYSIPTAGNHTVYANGTASFSNYNQGEDYRDSWRTISNYMWHGNPTYSWDPATHKVVEGGNTYEYDAAVKFSKFLNDPAHWNVGGGSECIEYGDPKIPYSGPATLNIQYDPMTGITRSSFYVLNWQNGTGTFSAVSAQDYELMGLLYRQCAIEWDNNGTVSATDADGNSCYLNTKSNYMHGWARHLGMMVASGNYHAPSDMNPAANMKIYRSIEDSITFCYTGDQIKFLLDYRNYGSVDAENVKIVENVPEDFVFVSASAGGVYDPGTHTVTWNIGTVPGVKSDGTAGVKQDFTKGNLAKTIGQVWYTLKAGNNASGRYCTTAEITCSNGLGWTSNEYPNYKTPTMQRNCVDVIKRSLIIEKTVNTKRVNSGNVVTYTIKFENTSDVGWLDGGRPRVNVSFANGIDGSRLQLMARLWNDAIEPYINYGNYRISYYLYDAGYNCYSGDAGCTSGWSVSPEIYEGGKSIGSSEGVVVSQENIVEGSDEFGRWNQRISIQFAPLLVTTTMHVSRYFGGAGCRIHKGGSSPMRGVWALYPTNYGSVDYKDDWSWGDNYNDDKGGLYYPVTPSWQKLDANGNSIEQPVSKWLTCGCTESALTIPNILVEEFDGYVWRRILGSGPMPGRDVDNVVIRDTLPKGLTFETFLTECPLEEFDAKLKTEKASDGRTIVVWSIPKLQVKQKGTISYTATTSFPSGKSCTTDDEIIDNVAWIYGDKNSPSGDTASVTVTCGKVPAIIEPTTMKKTADKEIYSTGNEIEYTIEYTQTHGTEYSNAGANASDWTNSGASFSGGKIAISQGNRATFSKAKSTNLYVEANWTLSDDQETEIFFRDNIRVVFKNVYQGLTATCYNGNTSLGTQTIAKASSPVSLKMDLTDDVLRIWIKKDITAGASFTFDGLPIKEGSFGFYGAAWGNFSYSDILIRLDKAFDLVITDPIPDGITFVSASNGGTNKNGTVTWDFSADNPIPYNKVYTVTWTGKINECNTLIENVAYANIRGHKENSIAAQAVVDCGVTVDAPTVKDVSYCQGDESEALTATADGTLTWYDSDKKTKLSSAPVPSTTDYGTTTYYVSQTVDGEESDKAELNVVVYQKPTKPTINTNSPVCVGQELTVSTLSMANATYKWTGPNSFSSKIVSNTFASATEDNAGDYSVVVTSEHGCVSDEATATVVVNAVPDKPIAFSPIQYCKNQTASELVADGENIQWYSAATGGTALTAAPTPATNKVQNVSYYATQTVDGCESARLEIQVSVVDKPDAPTIVTNSPLCVGDTLKLNTATADVYSWSGPNGFKTTAQDPSINGVTALAEGEYSLVVTMGDCVSEVGTATVVVNPIPSTPVPTNNGPKCEGESVTLNVTSVANATYKWEGPDNFAATTPKATATTSGEYSLTVTVNNCESKPGKTTVVVNEIPAAPIIAEGDESVKYCKGETTTDVTATAVSGATLKWYTTATGTTTHTSLTPSSTTVGKVDYYVSQTLNDCESERSHIEIETLEPPTKPTITTNSPICDGSDLTLSTTAEGTYAWTGPNGYTSTEQAPEIAAATNTAAGNYSLIVKVGNCTSEAGSATVVVNPIPTITIDPVANLCVDADDVTLNATATPAGGTGSFSGTGVSGMKFSPATAGVGTHTITYTYEVNGCSKSESIDITVQAKPDVDFELPTTACKSGSIIALTAADATQTTGTFTATPSLNLVSGFNPALATVKQAYSITYEYNDGVCSNSTAKSITVYDPEKPVGVNASILASKVTSAANIPAITASGVGQKWYSNAAMTDEVGTGNSYTAPESVVIENNVGKIGTYTYYVVSTEEGCTSTPTQVSLELLACELGAPTPTQAVVSRCTYEDPIEFEVTTEREGEVLWFLDETLITQGSDKTYTPTQTTAGTYTFNVQLYIASENCYSGKSSITYTIKEPPAVSFDIPEFVCDKSETLDFAKYKSQENGIVVYEGNEVTEFEPVAATDKYEFIYSYTAENGCAQSVTKYLEVKELPTITITPVADKCEYDADFDLSTYATPTGGTFSGNAVSAGKNFSPAATTTRNTATEITYTYTDANNCTNTESFNITVFNKPAITFAPINSSCIDDEVLDLLDYVTPKTNGEFSGNHVSGNSFNPESVGDFDITYTVTENGCSNSETKTAKVNDLPTLTITLDDVLCKNTGEINPVLQPAGGSLKINEQSATSINTDDLEAKTDYTLTYEYTSPTTNCKNSKDKEFEIREIASPLIQNKTIVMTSTDLTITADGVTGTVTWTDPDGNKTTGNSTSHPSSAVSGEWQYCATQTDGTCTSEPACIIFKVVDCPTPAPTVSFADETPKTKVLAAICASDEVPTFSVYTEDGAEIKWYKNGRRTYPSTPESYSPTTSKGKVGTTTWEVTQTTTGESGCEGPAATVTLTVNANPSISIDNEKFHLCDYDDKVQIEVSSNIPGGTYTYSGEAVSSDGYFTPADATTIGTAIPITITYETADTKCSAEENSRFYVHHVNPLSVVTPITQLESDYETVLEVTPSDKHTVSWYDACSDTKTKLGSGNSFQTGLVGLSSDDFGVTQTDRYGCESECSTIQVDRIKCPTPAPTVIIDRDEVCATDEVPSFAVRGKDGATFKWYENGELVASGDTFTPTSIQGIAGSYAWSVTQTTTGTNGCEGVAAPFTLKINPSPEINITIDDVICINGGVKDIMSNLSGTMYSFNGARVTEIDPTQYEPGFYDLIYAYYDPITGCTAVDKSINCYEESCLKKTIEIREIPQVMVDNQTTLVIATSFPISITSGQGGTYTWTSGTNVIGTGATIEHPNGAVVGSWDYCVTESDGTCSSDPACMKYTIIDCPVPAPNIIETEIIGCTNEPLKPIVAENQEYTVRWYKSTDMANYIDLGLEYTPSDLTTAGVYKFYATQYDGTCEGLPTMITYELKTTEQPEINGNKIICENEELELLADDEVLWYSQYPTATVDPDATEFNHIVSYETKGEYSLYVVRKDEYCSSNPLTISIQVNKIPTAPEITTNNVCEGDSVVYKAIGTDIVWYQDGFEIAEGETYVIKDLRAGEITLQATQTIDGCMSPKAEETTAIIYSIPSKPTAISTTICDYNDIEPVNVRAYTDKVIWYDDEELTNPVGEGLSYTPRTKETQTFYVVQSENSCISEAVAVNFNVQPQPDAVQFKQTNDIVSCEGNEVVIVASSANTVYWYENPAGYPIFTGRYFTVPESKVGEYTYYAKQKDKYGCVSDFASKKVVFNPAPQTASILQEDSICVYDEPGTLIVSHKSGENVSWVAPDGSTLGIGDTLTIPAGLLTQPGIYFFRARTTVSSCSYETRKDTIVKYQIYPQPAAPVLDKDYFCYDGKSAVLSSKGTDILWYTPQGSLIPGCPYKNECNTYYVEPGTYEVHMTQMENGCVSDTIANQFVISALPTPLISGKSELCANANEVYVITKTDETNAIDWKLTGNRVSYAISNYSNGFVRSVDWTNPGVDTIFVTETNVYGCKGSTEFVVEVIPVPDAEFMTESLGQEGVVTFYNTSEKQILSEGDFEKEYHVDYYWDFGRPTDTAIVIENAKTFERRYEYGDYTAEMTAINEFGCSSKIDWGFFVDVEHRLFIPSIFAPMNPGHEVRLFKPKGINCSSFEMWIYDAWGNLVYYSSGVDERGAPLAEWDGCVNGKMMQAGTYRYKILVTYVDHEEENLKLTQKTKPIWGNVTLLR